MIIYYHWSTKKLIIYELLVIFCFFSYPEENDLIPEAPPTAVWRHDVTLEPFIASVSAFLTEKYPIFKLFQRLMRWNLSLVAPRGDDLDSIFITLNLTWTSDLWKTSPKSKGLKVYWESSRRGILCSHPCVVTAQHPIKLGSRWIDRRINQSNCRKTQPPPSTLKPRVPVCQCF